MALSMSTKLQPCSKCPKGVGQVTCGGCQKWFCIQHLSVHRQELHQQMGILSQEHDQLQQNLNEMGNGHQHSLVHQVNQWESKSIERIREVANDVRCRLSGALSWMKCSLERSLSEITTALQESQRSESYTEIDIDKWMARLNELRQKLETPEMITLTHDDDRLSTHLPLIQLHLKTHKEALTKVNQTARWSTKAQTVAGSHGPGGVLNQLRHPYGFDIDDDGTLFIADTLNHRIMRWRPNATHGEIIAGGKGPGNRADQLNQPIAVLIDRINRSLIISQLADREVTRWSLDTQNQKFAQEKVVISNIISVGLAMDDEGFLYVSDFSKNEVRRYDLRDPSTGVVVAGANGQGTALNQLNNPRDIFIDGDHNVYVSDKMNHRVMKWMRDAREGVVVAGGHGRGNNLKQLNDPSGIFVDQMGSVYVVDQGNHRVVRWLKDANQGEVLIGGNGEGFNDNQLKWPAGMSFDHEGNLYVVDRNNHRVQRFDIRPISDANTDYNDKKTKSSDSLINRIFRFGQGQGKAT